MAITFGGDSISTDSSSINKNVGTTIDANGVSSGGNTSETLKSGPGGVYQSARPWGMRHINNPQNSNGYWTYANVSSNCGKRGGSFTSSGNWIDDSTGRFTAPVTGVYQFGSHGIAYGSNNDGRFSIYINDSHAAYSIAQTQNGNHAGFRGIPITLRLAAGDYVNYAQYSGTGCHTGNWSGFSGTLIG